MRLDGASRVAAAVAILGIPLTAAFSREVVVLCRGSWCGGDSSLLRCVATRPHVPPKVGDTGVVAVAKALEGNRTIRKLILEMTNTGNKGAVALAGILPSSNLARLDFGYCKITDEGAQVKLLVPPTHTRARTNTSLPSD